MRRLCHLCACPVVDGGVQLSQVDPQKLSQWWLINLSTNFDHRSLKEKWICQFCVWDIRFLHDSSESSSVSKKEVDIVWWPQLVDPIYETYYKGNMLRRCYVELKKIPDESLHLENKHENSNFEDTPSQLVNLHQAPVDQNVSSSVKEKSKKFKKCISYCRKFNRKEHLHTLLHKRHPDGKIRCSHDECNMSFLGHKERSDHAELVHGGGDRVQCIYCTKMFSIKHIRQHIKLVHCKIALRCSNNKCASYFESENDKRVHEKYAHGYVGDKTKCVICQKFLHTEYYFQHLKRRHRDLAVKCRFKLCYNYFISSHDMETHFQEAHEASEVRETIECLICNKKLKNNKYLRAHIQHFHSDVVVKCKFVGCGIYFKCQEDLDQHFQAKHAQSELKNLYRCSHCNYSCKRNDRLRKHISSAHSSAIFQCEHCPNVNFISKQLTLEHITKMHCPKPDSTRTTLV